MVSLALNFSLRSRVALVAPGFAGTFAAAHGQTVMTTSSWLQPSHATSLAQAEWCELVTKICGCLV